MKNMVESCTSLLVKFTFIVVYHYLCVHSETFTAFDHYTLHYLRIALFLIVVFTVVTFMFLGL